MRTIYLISFLLNLASIQSAFASPPSIQLKAYMLEKSSFATCTEETAMMKAAAKLAKVRFKHGRGPSKCSMEGDNNWLPYVQKLARQS
jgi:hypothetical protein